MHPLYVLVGVLSAMLAGDTVQLRIKTKARTTGGGTVARSFKYATYSNAQTDPLVVDLGPATCDLYCEATLKQTAGTGRTFPWKLMRVA